MKKSKFSETQIVADCGRSDFAKPQFLLKYGKLHVHPLGYTDFPTFQQDDDGDGPEKKERKLLLTSTFDCA